MGSISGSSKNANITVSNEVVYAALGELGSKAIDSMIPGPTPNVSKQIKEGVKQLAGLVESQVKSQTDKVVEKYKDQDKK